MSLGEKVLFLPFALARRGDFGARFDYGIYLGCRSFDGQAYIGTPSGVIRCRTVRQLSAQERWDTEFVLSIKGTPRSPDGERAGDVSIRVGVHPPDIDPPIIPRRMRLTREMFERFGLTAQCLGCRAIRTGMTELPGSLATERGSSELGTRRVEDLRATAGSRGHEGTGASSSRDGAGNEQEASGGPVVMSEPQPRPS